MKASARTIGLLVLSVAACAAPASSTPTTRATAGASSAPGADALIGAWSTTITEADARAAGLTGAGEIQENTGTFTTTFAADGTWTTAQVTTAPIRWPVFRGTYRATGEDTLELATTFPPDYAGDLVTVRWARDASGVRFTLISPDDAILRMNLEAHPWQPAP